MVLNLSWPAVSLHTHASVRQRGPRRAAALQQSSRCWRTAGFAAGLPASLHDGWLSDTGKEMFLFGRALSRTDGNNAFPRHRAAGDAYHTCSFTFFPSTSMVFTLKSMPGREEGDREREKELIHHRWMPKTPTRADRGRPVQGLVKCGTEFPRASSFCCCLKAFCFHLARVTL